MTEKPKGERENSIRSLPLWAIILLSTAVMNGCVAEDTILLG